MGRVTINLGIRILHFATLGTLCADNFEFGPSGLNVARTFEFVIGILKAACGVSHGSACPCTHTKQTIEKIL